MADRLLREFYDENLALYLRAYRQQSGIVYHTVQQSAAGFKHATSMARPIYAHICLTDKCNLKCPYCYAYDEKNQKDMTFSQVAELIHLCDINDIMDITWTGGEPFMRPDFLQIINLAHKTGIHQSILTNGTFIGDGYFECSPHDNILYQISLNEAWSRTLENQKNHDKVYRTAQRCAMYNIPYLLNIILEPQSEYEIEMLVKELIEYKIRNARFAFKMSIGKEKNSEYGLYISELRKCIGAYKTVRERYREKINIFYQFDDNQFCNRGVPRRFFMCEAGTTEIFIDNNGDVYPCPLFKAESEFRCGNVFSDQWDNLWNSRPMCMLRNIGECTGCDYDCKVWCRGLKYFYDGNMQGKSYFCLHTL